jgi:uncharacterized HAD superfamily protein
MINYVSLNQLQQDIMAWERKLPYYDGFVGIPRSGMIPATLLALRRNVRLIDLNEFIQDPAKAIQASKLRSNNPACRKPIVNRVLVVDDCSSPHSASMSAIQERMPQSVVEIHYGAVYRAAMTSKVDRWHSDLPLPRLFEWNWFRHRLLNHSLLDIDGVVCADWTLRPEKDDDPEFKQHLATAKALFIPEYPVLGFVTSRLAKFKPQTESWLKRHGCAWQHLKMSPHRNVSERRLAGDHGLQKGYYYREMEQAQLFIESNHKQAEQIVAVARKPVLSIERQVILNP